MAKKCVSMTMQPPLLQMGGVEIGKLTLPKGAVGVLFVWDTKKAAREWHGRKVELLEIEIQER